MQKMFGAPVILIASAGLLLQNIDLRGIVERYLDESGAPQKLQRESQSMMEQQRTRIERALIKSTGDRSAQRYCGKKRKYPVGAVYYPPKKRQRLPEENEQLTTGIQKEIP